MRNIADFHKSLNKAFSECRCDYCIDRIPGIQKPEKKEAEAKK